MREPVRRRRTLGERNHKREVPHPVHIDGLLERSSRSIMDVAAHPCIFVEFSRVRASDDARVRHTVDTQTGGDVWPTAIAVTRMGDPRNTHEMAKTA